jgi:hypothetical protein
MIVAAIIINTTPEGVSFRLESDQSKATESEILLGGFFNVAINKAGEMLLQHRGEGKMVSGDIEKHIAPHLKEFLDGNFPV